MKKLKEKAKCHGKCRYDRFCYKQGSDDLEPEDCCQYYHIEDILADARDIEEEEKKARGEFDDEDEIPFCDEEDYESYDGDPEEWE